MNGASSAAEAARAPAEGGTMQVKANGIAINCRIDGREGVPWLVWSNSLATNLDSWEEQAQEFKSAFRVLRYDQRGHGATEAPAGRYSWDDFDQ